MPRRLTPGVQRMPDRLGDAPVAVFDATWDLLAWNPLWAALMGDPSDGAGTGGNEALALVGVLGLQSVG